MEWIPVNQSLPYNGAKVLITTVRDNSGGKFSDIEYSVEVAEYNKHGGNVTNAQMIGGFNIQEKINKANPICATAWMSLPEPY